MNMALHFKYLTRTLTFLIKCILIVYILNKMTFCFLFFFKIYLSEGEYLRERESMQVSM